MRSALPGAIVVATLSLLLAGCGGGSTSEAADGGPSATSSAPTATATASVTRTASTPVTKAEFIERFKTEPDSADLSAEQMDCLADGYLKYVDPTEMRQYVDGEIAMDDLTDPADVDEAKKALLGCFADLLTDLDG